MGRKHNNQLPENLPQLQNLIKRDPASYKDEFLQQQRHYKSLLDIFLMRPSDYDKNLDALIMFMAHTSHCYPHLMTTYASELIEVLQNHSTVLDADMRMTFCRGLILMRNKGLLAPTDLLSLFFELLRCKDKQLRSFLKTHITSDIKNINSKHKNASMNKILQNFMYTMLRDDNGKAAKMSLGIMIDLYRKNIWNDAKTVNVISTGCFSKITKVMVAALKFFVTVPAKNESDDESSSSDDDTPTTREVIMANKFNKKTRKRMKNLKKVKKVVEKNKKIKKAPIVNFNAIHLIHDPQEFAEKLFKQMEKRNERFEVKILTLDVISRLIGAHQLFLFNYYPYVQRFLQPHQREVTKLLQFIAQATHELIPPDTLEPIIRTLADNFVTERNSSDVMAIGLNAMREMCMRAPLAMSEDLLLDLSDYKNHRERSVMMAARSLIHVYRASLPTLLHKKHRGRPTEASLEIKARQYGEIDAKEFIPGAEVLLEENENEDSDKNEEDDDEDEWIDVNHSSDDNSDDEEEEEEEQVDDVPDEQMTMKETVTKITKEEMLQRRKALASEVSLSRILTDEDFKKIEIIQLRKQVTSAKNLKRRAEPEKNTRGEMVDLADIENIHKKRKHDKQARIESMKKGRENREKIGNKDWRKNPYSSKTNKERTKKKNFMMIKHKVRGKVKKSFKDKQIALRNHLIKLKKMK